MRPEQRLHRGFDIGKQLSLALSLVGVLLLIAHFTGQIMKGTATAGTLIIGAASLICGVILTLLFVILIRLHRIERQLSGSGHLESNRDGGDADAESHVPKNEGYE